MRFGLLSKKSDPLIGVDISASAVKMIELSDTGKGGRRVERYAIAPLPKDAMADGNITKPEAVEDAMRTAWKSMKTRTRNIVMSLPSSAVYPRNITLPKELSENELEDRAIEEARQSVPTSNEEVTLDFQVLGPSERVPTDNDILIVATTKNRVEERVAVAEAVGLKPVIMDVDTYAALRAFQQISFLLPNAGKDQLVAIIDIGAATTHINVLFDGKSVFTREHPFGGQQLTEDVKRHYPDIPTFEEAEKAKRKGLLPETYDAEVLRPFMDNISTEITRALRLMYTSTNFQSDKVDHILLAGGCATIPGLDEMLFSKMDTSTMILNPFAKMALSSQVNARQLSADASSLFVACGLALRRFDNV